MTDVLAALHDTPSQQAVQGSAMGPPLQLLRAPAPPVSALLNASSATALALLLAGGLGAGLGGGAAGLAGGGGDSSEGGGESGEGEGEGLTWDGGGGGRGDREGGGRGGGDGEGGGYKLSTGTLLGGGDGG